VEEKGGKEGGGGEEKEKRPLLASAVKSEGRGQKAFFFSSFFPPPPRKGKKKGKRGIGRNAYPYRPIKRPRCPAKGEGKKRGGKREREEVNALIRLIHEPARTGVVDRKGGEGREEKWPESLLQ